MSRPTRVPGDLRHGAATALGALSLLCGTAALAETRPPREGRTLTDVSVAWPAWDDVLHVLALRDYNTRVVLLGVTCLGLAAGIVGAFVLLRKRALLGDALSHATLPGICVAFMLMGAAGGSGKWLPGLLLGATASGVLGVLSILAIVHLTRIKEDAALGIVLSVFFGLGVALLGVIQSSSTGYAAGLKSFIYGKTASMLASDALLIAAVGSLCAATCVALFKELGLLCFDADFAAAIGRRVVALDVTLMAVVVAVTVVGLQAVGLILVVALLVIPPAAARFWTHRLTVTVAVSGLLGALSGAVGAAASAVVPRLPSGAIIVVVAGAVFLLSLIAGRERGLIVRWVRRRALARRVGRQNLLRAVYELIEAGGERPGGEPVRFDALIAARSWTARELRALIRRGAARGDVRRAGTDGIVLTEAGRADARRVTRNHRLWELFLITHADVAASHVDRDADSVEHVLDARIVAQLETQLARSHPDLGALPNPHAVTGVET